MTFKDLKIIDPILRAIEGEGYEVPSPIQIEAIPLLLERKDLLASAQTGTGKTAAFAIPIIQQIVKAKESNTDQDKRIIRALILAPTRELAEQIKTSFQTYSGKLNIKTGVIYGGVGQRAQENMIRGGIDILIATPGRLMDLMQQKIVRINTVEHFVLDEADMLLDMGFIKDVKYIKGFIPKTRQTMMFSATISKEISALAADLLVDPQHLDMAPPEKMIDKISHSVFFIEKKEKIDLLLDLLTDKKLESVLVFMKTKHTANKLVEQLQEYGVGVDAIHGSKSQRARQTALDDFKNKRIRVLVATDIAARGIDIDELSHVINYDLPISPETYVHRIGRTGRRGLTGETFTFCSRTERSLLRAVESHTGLKLKVLKLDPVSPDSKFKKIVEGKTSDSEFTKDISAKTNNDYKESNRGSRDNKDFNRGENRFKPKKNDQGEIIENAPANFGKQKRTTRKKYKNYENNVSTSFDEVKTKPNNKPSISSEPSGFIKEDPTMKANKEPRREYFPRSNKPHFEKNEGERKDNNQQSNYAKRDRSFTKKNQTKEVHIKTEQIPTNMVNTQNVIALLTEKILVSKISQAVVILIEVHLLAQIMPIDHIQVVVKTKAVYSHMVIINQKEITRNVIAPLIKIVKTSETNQPIVILIEIHLQVRTMQIVQTPIVVKTKAAHSHMVIANQKEIMRNVIILLITKAKPITLNDFQKKQIMEKAMIMGQL